MRLFLDANVVFSAAHLARCRAQHLVALADAAHCELVTSAHALEEARRNLALKSRDFGRLYGRTLRGVRVVTPAAALAAVLESVGTDPRR